MFLHTLIYMAIVSSETGQCELSPSTSRNILPHAPNAASICWGLCCNKRPNTPILKGHQYPNATFLYCIHVLPVVDSPRIFRIAASNYPKVLAAMLISFSCFQTFFQQCIGNNVLQYKQVIQEKHSSSYICSKRSKKTNMQTCSTIMQVFISNLSMRLKHPKNKESFFKAID